MCFERCLDIEVSPPPELEKFRFILNYAAVATAGRLQADDPIVGKLIQL
jgi:hypothetical protein